MIIIDIIIIIIIDIVGVDISNSIFVNIGFDLFNNNIKLFSIFMRVSSVMRSELVLLVESIAMVSVTIDMVIIMYEIIVEIFLNGLVGVVVHVDASYLTRVIEMTRSL